MKNNLILKSINMKKMIIIVVFALSTQLFNSCVKQDDVSEQIKMEQIKADGDWNGGDVDDGGSDCDEEEDEE